MTRKEQIKREADRRWENENLSVADDEYFYSDPGEYAGFIKGAEWADKNPNVHFVNISPEECSDHIKERNYAQQQIAIAMEALEKIRADGDGLNDGWLAKETLDKIKECSLNKKE